MYKTKVEKVKKINTLNGSWYKKAGALLNNHLLLYMWYYTVLTYFSS